MSVRSGEAFAIGLTSVEAAAALAVHGPNALPEAPGVGMLGRFLRQFRSPLIYILMFALALDLALWSHEGMHGAPTEAIAIGLILLLNAVLGSYQEGKAEAALARLKAIAAPTVWVFRDGTLIQSPATVLVPGDVVRLEAGDRVPADGALREGEGVLVDESILTGESLPLDKVAGSTLSSGTLVVRGRGYVEVARTGASSAMGRLATIIGGIEAGQTPLERRLGAFGNQVAIAMLALGLALTIGGVVVEGIGRLGQIALFSVALAVAAVPEGLPAVLTLAMAMGVERLTGRRAIVRRLSAVEALGSVTVIATDKTGTLTENRMHVRAIDAPDTEKALQAMILANDAEFETRVGDPLEIALYEYAAGRGADVSTMAAACPRVSSRPFDSAIKFMRVTVAGEQGHVSYLKGAPEVLIDRSRLSDADKRAWEAKALHHAAEGYRVIALAWTHEEGEEDVEFIGLVMLWDPPRPEVPDAIRAARAAGIRVLMITGDHPATAEAVGRSVGISTSRVATGADIERLDARELEEAVRHVNVFARVSPEQKLKLVEALQANGEIVAVTGDGVNDAPALKRSDVGIAMGVRGSDVSREVADLVLMDDNFATIVAAIEEGRSIYENIQKFVRFFFSTDLALILLMTGGLALAYLLGIRDPAGGTFMLPLTAVQLLWINIVADGPPAVALAFDRNPGVMSTPPRPPGSRLLDDLSLRFVLASALVKALLGLAMLAIMPRYGYSSEETRTAVFLFESLTQLVFVYPSRRIRVVPLPNLWIHLSMALGIALQLATVMVPQLRALLGLVPLNAPTLAGVLALAVVTWVVADLMGRRLAHRSAEAGQVSVP